MKKSILIIALVIVSLSSSFAGSLVGKSVRCEGKQYTVLFEGENYTVLIDKLGNRKILSFKKK